MDLKLYPLDRQACELRIASCNYQLLHQQNNEHRYQDHYHDNVSSYMYVDGWTTDDLIYHWKKEDPVQITDDLNLPR